MKFSLSQSLSFLASDISQMPLPGTYGNDGIEAVTFNRSDLTDENWDKIWQNVGRACDAYGAANVTYHFPVNDSDYVEDREVFQKLQDAYARACELGLKGMVVHSNRIKTFTEWKPLDIAAEQKRVIDSLTTMLNSADRSGNTWLALENMPIVGNSGQDIDPLFCYVDDFKTLPADIGVVWDVCHATSTRAYLEADAAGQLGESLVIRKPTVHQFEKSLDFVDISSQIRHFHFAGFKGLNDPARSTECFEGVTPADSDPGEKIYAEILTRIANVAGHDSKIASINFEVQESDYQHRKNGPEILTWARQILDA